MNDIPLSQVEERESSGALPLDSERFFSFLNTVTEREPKLTRATAVVQDFLETMASEVSKPLEVFENLEEKINSVTQAILEIIQSFDMVDGIRTEIEYYSRQITTAIAILRAEVDKVVASQKSVLATAGTSEVAIEIALRNDNIIQPHQRIRNISNWIKSFKTPDDLIEAPEGTNLGLINEFVDFAAKANTGHNDFNRGNFGNIAIILKEINEIIERKDENYLEIIDDLENLLNLIIQKLYILGKDGANRDKQVETLLDDLAVTPANEG